MAEKRQPPAKSVKEFFAVFDNMPAAERIRLEGLADLERMRAPKHPNGMRLPPDTPEQQVMTLEAIYRLAEAMHIPFDRSVATQRDGLVTAVYDPMQMRIEIDAESTSGLTATPEDAMRVPGWAEKPAGSAESAGPRDTEEQIRQHAAECLRDAREARAEARKQAKNARRKEKKRQTGVIGAVHEDSPAPPPTSPDVVGSGSPEEPAVLAPDAMGA